MATETIPSHPGTKHLALQQRLVERLVAGCACRPAPFPLHEVPRVGAECRPLGSPGEQVPQSAYEAARVVGREQESGLSVLNELLVPADVRSEGHTSELQSLMRTSYAVFCLQK